MLTAGLVTGLVTDLVGSTAEFSGARGSVDALDAVPSLRLVEAPEPGIIVSDLSNMESRATAGIAAESEC